MKSEKDLVSIARKFFDYFNDHNWEKMAGLYAEPADFMDPSFGKEIVQQSREQTAQKYREMGEIFPDLRDDIIQIYPSGENNVIIEFVSSGTAPDGTKWTLPICTIFTIEKGQITEDFSYYDRK